MTVNCYGYDFCRLSEADIEMVRNWRNSEQIKSFMHDKRHITRDGQIKWYSRINNVNNWYFVVKKDGISLGLIGLKSVDFDRKTTEPGIMMANPRHPESLVPASVGMLLLGEFGFHVLGMKRFIAHMFDDHTKALSNNDYLGAKVIDHFGDKSLHTEGSLESFSQSSLKIHKALKVVTGKSGHITLQFEKGDDSSISSFISNRFNLLSTERKKYFSLAKR